MNTLSRLPSRSTRLRRDSPLGQGSARDEHRLTNKSVRLESVDGSNSSVVLQWHRGVDAKDETQQVITHSRKPWPLLKEEVRGQKIEDEIILPPGSSRLNILPGGIFDAHLLLKTGEFQYLAWEHRQACKIWATSCGSATQTATIAGTPTTTTSQCAAELALQGLLATKRLRAAACRAPSSPVRRGTLPASIGLQIGASYFCMAANGARSFAFSEARFRYLYVYTFNQVFLTVSSQAAKDPGDLLCHADAYREDMLYLKKATYGRRLYAIMESELDLASGPGVLKGSLEWIVVSAKLQQPSVAAALGSSISLRAITQSGEEWLIPDPTMLQSSVDAYFSSDCTAEDILPLSFNVTDLWGAPVCLMAEAHLTGHHFLGGGQSLLNAEKGLLQAVPLRLRASHSRPRRLRG